MYERASVSIYLPALGTVSIFFFFSLAILIGVQLKKKKDELLMVYLEL